MGNAIQVHLLSDERSPDVAPNPVLKKFASNGVILVCKNDLLPLFERRDVALRYGTALEGR